MHITTFHRPLSELQTDLLILVLDGTQSLFELEHEELTARLAEIKQGFEQERISREYVFEQGGLGTVVVYSTQTEKAYSLWENLKTFTARALRLASETGRSKVTIALNSSELAARAVEGALLGTYAYERYKNKKRNAYGEVTLELMVPESDDLEGRIEAARVIAEAVNFARDLANEPANDLVPEKLAEEARKLGARHGLEVEVWNEAELGEHRCTGLLTVGGGSAHPPRMIRVSRPV